MSKIVTFPTMREVPVFTEPTLTGFASQFVGDVYSNRGRFGGSSNYIEIAESRLTFVGSGDVYLNYGKTTYANTDTGFILGLDNGTAKLYIGNSSEYLNWTGSALNISGTITATAGTIGGWTIGATTLTGGTTNIILDSSNKAISINSATFGASGIQLQYNSGTPRLYVGDGANAFFQYDGTKVTWKASNTELDSSGNLTAAAATITGSTISTPTITSIQSGSEVSIQGWQQDMDFTASDYNTVAWGAGTITLMDGTSYGIYAGNTGDMVSTAKAKYESYIINDDGANALYGIKYIAQTFTPSANHTIGSVKVKTYRVGSPGILEVHIQGVDGSNNPDGADVCSGTTDADDFTTNTNGAWYEITLGSGAPLTSGIRYAMLLQIESDGGNPTNNVSWRADNSAAAYAGGDIRITTDGGSGWTAYGTFDEMFEEWSVAGGLYYIYLDTATSSTALQTSTTNTDAVGSGKILIGVCQNNTDTTAGAEFKAFGGSANDSTFLIDNLVANSTSTNEFISNTAQIKDLIVTNAKINDLVVSKLTAGTITSKAITLAVAAGTGDVYIAAGKTDFTNTDTGFILGIDDSDSDKAKLYIGSSTVYFNFTGTAITLQGAGFYTGATDAARIQIYGDNVEDMNANNILLWNLIAGNTTWYREDAAASHEIGSITAPSAGVFSDKFVVNGSAHDLVLRSSTVNILFYCANTEVGEITPTTIKLYSDTDLVLNITATDTTVDAVETLALNAGTTVNFVNIQNAGNDRLSVGDASVQVNTHLLVTADSQYNIGSNAVRWANVYADNFPASPIEVGESGIETFKKIGKTNRLRKGKYWLDTNVLPSEFKIEDKDGKEHTELKRSVGILIQTVKELCLKVEDLEKL